MTEQLNLLEQQHPVVASTAGRVHADDPATSRRAAARIAIKAGALKHRILRHLAHQGDAGANDWELHVACDPHGRVHSAATRRKELQDDFDPPLVHTTTTTRATDTPGNEGHVHVLTERGREVLAEIERSLSCPAA